MLHNEGTLRNEVTIDGPGAFSRPFVTRWTARHAAPGGYANPFSR